MGEIRNLIILLTNVHFENDIWYVKNRQLHKRNSTPVNGKNESEILGMRLLIDSSMTGHKKNRR
jgi:hypothetical protein